MHSFTSPRHDPPQVLTVVALTCRTCGGAESTTDEHGTISWCHACERGYEKVLVDAQELHLLLAGRPAPAYLHRALVALAAAQPVRLPVLTHNTADLPRHLRPGPSSRQS